MTDLQLTPTAVTSPAWPTVTVVVPTHNRPALVRLALGSIQRQDYSGEIDIIVVHDREEIDICLREEFGQQLRSIANDRSPGLCGARNAGILAAGGELVAFCDDDDSWEPNKLRLQVERLLASPDAVMASTAMSVDFDGHRSDRLAGKSAIFYEDLLVSRMSMLHSSSFLLRRDWITRELLNEELPGSMGEDWDLLLRAAQQAPIAHLDQPLVNILWGSTSFFSRDWSTKLTANSWFLDTYADIRNSAVGAARLAGQNAFFAAASGDRRGALGWVGRTFRTRLSEPRAWLALPVIVIPRLSGTILGRLHRHGRGI